MPIFTLLLKLYLSGSDVTFYNESRESEKMQLYRGIYTGLGVPTDNIAACINETLETVQTFEECFHAFKMGKVITNYIVPSVFGTSTPSLELQRIIVHGTCTRTDRAQHMKSAIATK